MSAKTARMNLSGAMDFIKKSKYPLTPLYEAITNSLEAISQRDFSSGEEPLITVRLYFTGLINEIKELQKIEIIDNGEGFTLESYKRFGEFFDKSKGYNNNGTGRLQFLHRFDKIEVESKYNIEGITHQRSFTCDTAHFIQNEKDGACDTTEEFLTKITLSGGVFEGEEKTFFDELSIEKIIKDINRQFLLRFYLDAQKEDLSMPKITVIFIKDEEELDSQSLTPESIPEPQSIGKIKVPYLKIVDSKADKVAWKSVEDKDEVIKWAHFKMPEGDLEKNDVYLCSKDMPVQALTFKQIKKKESIDGFKYLTAFYGEVLDNPKNVSDTVDCFKFPDKKETETSVSDLFFDEDEEFLFFDSIKEQVNRVIPSIYKDIFDLRSKQEKDIERIAKAHGIPIEVALKARINLTDDEQLITKKIYIEQSNILAEKGFKAKILHESLNELNPISDNYQKELEKKVIELSALIEDQNKEELSRYIIRREMVADILKKILTEELKYQRQPAIKGKKKEKEGLVHDLIFKRKSSDTSILNDLWILNEEFLHFYGCSDIQLSQIKNDKGENLLIDLTKEQIEKYGIKPERRPDIFLFAEEGKCVLVELKAPRVDLSDHLNQMGKYCRLIANYCDKKFDRFYCYLIGEDIDLIDIPDDYDETVNGDWLKPDESIKSNDNNRNKIAIMQTEIIKMSSLYSRAHRRNKSFAEKLGLPDLLANDGI
ncbi:MAG: hypothetical protein KAS59_02305 [Alphaproteobacteria bacterium]|nr:hypothetical protein [Alphaproteobacteria bacterium]